MEETKMSEVIVITSGKGGVGKTTTIAKIASHFCVDGGKKVALLTADTYRIAAAEQLRTYANIRRFRSGLFIRLGSFPRPCGTLRIATIF